MFKKSPKMQEQNPGRHFKQKQKNLKCQVEAIRLFIIVNMYFKPSLLKADHLSVHQLVCTFLLHDKQDACYAI